MPEFSRPDLPRADRREVVYNDQDGFYYREGRPFTGIAITDHPKARTEQEFREGLRWGVAYVHLPSGALIMENRFRMDMMHGVQREWDDDGALVREELLEYGVLLEARDYGPEGEVTEEERHPAPDDDPRLIDMRQRYGDAAQVEEEERRWREGGPL